MATHPTPPHMTVEEYLALDRASPDIRYEYDDGVIVALAGGSLNHSRLKVRCASLLERELQDKDCRVFDSDARVQLSAQRYVYPDITVSCSDEDRGTGDIIRSPRVVFEVLSPSTEKRDRRQKYRDYRACPSIQEYVLVHSDQWFIEVFRRQGHFMVYVDFGPNDIFALPSIGVHIPVAEIYGDILAPPDEDED